MIPNLAADVVIVGAGLFGSIAAHALRERDVEVILIDNGKATAGSRAAGCLFKDSWLAALSTEQRREAVDYLMRNYPVTSLPFKTRVGWPLTLQHIHPKDVMAEDHIFGSAKSVEPGHVTLADGRVLRARRAVLVAAGWWSADLVPVPGMRGMAGVSFTFPTGLKESVFRVWAPYKQAIAFNRVDGAWYSDGTAVLQENWKPMYSTRSFQRGQEYGLPMSMSTAREGIRPYVKGFSAGYMKEVRPKLWVSTGGAKNGVVLAALHALRFVKEIL